MIVKSARLKRSNLQQPFSRLLKLKEMNPIFKALLLHFIAMEEKHENIANFLD